MRPVIVNRFPTPGLDQLQFLELRKKKRTNQLELLSVKAFCSSEETNTQD